MIPTVAGTMGSGASAGGGFGGDFETTGGLIPHVSATHKSSHDRHRADVEQTLIPTVVGTLSDGAHNGGGSTARTLTQDELSRCLNAGGMGRQDWETETLVIQERA